VISLFNRTPRNLDTPNVFNFLGYQPGTPRSGKVFRDFSPSRFPDNYYSSSEIFSPRLSISDTPTDLSSKTGERIFKPFTKKTLNLNLIEHFACTTQSVEMYLKGSYCTNFFLGKLMLRNQKNWESRIHIFSCLLLFASYDQSSLVSTKFHKHR